MSKKYQKELVKSLKGLAQQLTDIDKTKCDGCAHTYEQHLKYFKKEQSERCGNCNCNNFVEKTLDKGF